MLNFTEQGRKLFFSIPLKWPAAVLIIHEVGFYIADPDRSLDTDRNMIRIISHPYRHFFPGFEHRSFDQQRFDFDGVKFSKTGRDGFLSDIADVGFIELVVQKHFKFREGKVLVEWYTFIIISMNSSRD